MKKSDVTPDSYLASLDSDAKTDLETLDTLISGVFKGETRVLWEGVFWGGSQQSIIGYGDLKYERPKETIEWFKVGLALQKNYISIYVSAVDGKKYLSETMGPDLGKVKVGKSSIGFKSLADIDTAKLEKLLQKAKELLSD